MTSQFEVNILMLVEDSDDDIIISQRKIFKSSLKIGEFLIAKTLQEGLKLVKEKNIDVVLLDLNLPESRGLDTLKIFRQYYSGLVIVCTSLEDEMIGIEAIRQGADDCIIKSMMNETMISRAILYARERRKADLHVTSMREKLEMLSNTLGV